MATRAIIVQQRQRGPGQMLGMGATGSVLTDLADAATGGLVTSTEDQLNRLEIALKVSIAVSVVSGLLSVWALSTRR